MTVVSPEAGLVISYAYLWQSEFKQGQEEGHKDRPCLIIGVDREPDGSLRVLVLPITHAPPAELNLAQEIPETMKHHLRLDEGRCWIVLIELNEFHWPGPDLRHGAPGNSVVYERVPPRLFEKIRRRFIDLARAGRSRVVKRTE